MELAYFYTLSALLQGFAALIAFSGVFAVFRIETIRREIDSVVSYWRHYLSKTQRLPGLASPDEIFSSLSQHSEKYDSQIESVTKETIDAGIARYRLLLARKLGAKRYGVAIMVVGAAVVFMCMWLLPWAKSFSEGGQVAIILTVLAVASFSLYVTVITVMYWFGVRLPRAMYLGISLSPPQI